MSILHVNEGSGEMALGSKQVIGRGFLLVLLLALLVLLFYRPVEVGDDWWHLSVGRWMSEHHQVPVQDPFPFAGEKTVWLHTHWLGSFVLYEAFYRTGIEGLKILRTGYFLVVVGIFFIYFYHKISFPLLIAVTIFLANGLSTRHFLRPELFNFLFVQIMLILLLKYEWTGNRRLLYVLPLLGILWFNLHLGAAIYGAALLGMFILSSGLNAVWLRRSDPGGSAEYWRRAGTLGLMLLAFAVSFIVTPLGWQGLLSQLKIFFAPDDSRMFYETLRYIGESQHPHVFRWSVLWFWGLVGLSLFFLVRSKFHPLSRTLLFVVPLGMFLFMQRNGAFFALTAAYVIADNATRLSQAGWGQTPRWQRVSAGLALVVILAVFSYLMLGKVLMKEVDGGSEQRCMLKDVEDFNLADGVDFLKRNKIAGPVFNTNILTGGYWLWAGYPELRPFLDGRSIAFSRLIESQAVQAKPEKYWSLFEKKYQVSIIAGNSDKLSRRFFRYINSLPEWKLVFVEGSLLIFVRQSEFVLPAELAEYPNRLKAISVSEKDVGYMINNYRTPRGGSWRDWIDPPPWRVADWDAGIALLSLGYDGAGVRKLADGLRQGFVGSGKEIPAVLRRLESRGMLQERN